MGVLGDKLHFLEVWLTLEFREKYLEKNDV